VRMTSCDIPTPTRTNPKPQVMLHRNATAMPGTSWWRLLPLLAAFLFSGWAAAQSCDWTVEVEGTTYGDEVSWSLTDASSTVILSGGGYGLGFFDSQTANAAGPMTFFIEAIGTYGDNQPSYTVHNGTALLVSGSLLGGDDATHAALNCA